MRRGFTLIEIMFATAIVGVLLALTVPAYRARTCAASETEAKTALRGVMALEEHVRAERDGYVDVASACPQGSTTCVVFASKGRLGRFAVSATGAGGTYTATAVGLPGTAMAGSIWRTTQDGKLTDVGLLCRGLQ